MARVLIVEDDPAVLALYKNVFHLSGHEVETAENGEVALTKLKGGALKPDIILLDIMMPKVNGLDVLKKLKQDPEYEPVRPVPVIVLTNLESLSGPRDLNLALELGAVQYFIKSQMDPADIVKKVEEALRVSPLVHK
ncbi:MAG TPA: response regulator [Candidatus Paceibacterota bacterium]|nr:response regulator [Candidatus Paceibacterota bacterium]